MSPHRVHILGASGAGTTTLARALAADLGIPVALVKNALGLSV